MKQKYIINLGRELGSGGRVIGEIVARELAIEFYDKRLIKLAAEQSGISAEIFEQADETERKRGLSALVSYLKSPFAQSEISNHDVLSSEALFAIQSDVIRDVASRGSALFVGRCADYVLRDYPQSVNIFITADKRDRLRRLIDIHNISEIEAEEMIRRGDESRSQYYNYYGTGRWGYAASYDLCINSSILGLECTAELIVDFVRRRVAK